MIAEINPRRQAYTRRQWRQKWAYLGVHAAVAPVSAAFMLAKPGPTKASHCGYCRQRAVLSYALIGATIVRLCVKSGAA